MKQLDEYFGFSGSNPVRIKGHRVGINLIIEDFKSGMPAEKLAAEFPTIRLEDVFATLTYYLQNQQQLDNWLASLQEWTLQDIHEKQAHPSPVVQRLRRMKVQGTHRS